MGETDGIIPIGEDVGLGGGCGHIKEIDRDLGRLSRLIQVDKSFYGEDLVSSDRMWIEESSIEVSYSAGPRVGIDYAGTPWKDKPWRYLMDL